MNADDATPVETEDQQRDAPDLDALGSLDPVSTDRPGLPEGSIPAQAAAAGVEKSSAQESGVDESGADEPGADESTDGASSSAVAQRPDGTELAGDGTGAGDPVVVPDGGDTDGRPEGGRGKPQVLLLAVVAGCVLLVDAISKALIVATMDDGQSIRLLGGLVYFSLIRNPGAAFSMATGMTWILAIVAIGVVVLIIKMAPRLRSPIWAVCLGLILGGALGNLTDRIFRSPGVLRGHVVDFISLFGPDAKYFAVFNLADSAITIGGVMLVIVTLLGIDFDGRRIRRSQRDKGTRDGQRAGAGPGGG